jgi:hypothetical protein
VIKKHGRLIVLVILMVWCGAAKAAPPSLPPPTIERNSGVFITSTAYLTNPPEQTNIFGKPCISTRAVFLGEKDLEVFVTNQF